MDSAVTDAVVAGITTALGLVAAVGWACVLIELWPRTFAWLRSVLYNDDKYAQPGDEDRWDI